MKILIRFDRTAGIYKFLLASSRFNREWERGTDSWTETCYLAHEIFGENLEIVELDPA